MASEKWADRRFGKRIKVKRDARGWSQSDLAKMMSKSGTHMHSTTVAKIEAGERSVRITEAVGLADLFETSLDSLLGRSPGQQNSELTYLLRALAEFSQQAWTSLQTIHELLRELPAEFPGADGPQTLTDNWDRHLAPASDALTRLTIASDFLLHQERENTHAAPVEEGDVVKGTQG